MRVVSVKTWKWHGSPIWKSTISWKPGRKMTSFCENRAMSVFSSPKNIFWRKKIFIDFFSFNFWKISFFIKNAYKFGRKIGKMIENRPNCSKLGFCDFGAFFSGLYFQWLDFSKRQGIVFWDHCACSQRFLEKFYVPIWFSGPFLKSTSIELG